MSMQERNTVLENIRRSLRRNPDSPVTERPAILPPRHAGEVDAEIDRLIAEINALSGIAQRLDSAQVKQALRELVDKEKIKQATLWSTEELARLRVADHLRDLDVEIISGNADQHTMAQCDLGVTEVDFALPETGTLGLLASAIKPRAVSLLPRVHLAIVRPENLRADLHQVFEEAKRHNYLIFITGPSRTADIELTVALGVHGPKVLYAWVLSG